MKIVSFLLLVFFSPNILWGQESIFSIRIIESEIIIEQGKDCTNITLRLVNNAKENLLLYYDFNEGVRGYPFPEKAFCDSLRRGSHLGLFIVDSNEIVLEANSPFHISKRQQREIKRRIEEDEQFVKEELNREENRGKNITPEFLLAQRYAKENKLFLPAGCHKEYQLKLYLGDYYLKTGEYKFYLLFNAAKLSDLIDQDKLKNDKAVTFQGCIKSNETKLIVK